MEANNFNYNGYWSKSMSYEQYRTLIDDLLAEGKATGPEQSEALVHYSELNVTRMKRIDKTTKVSEELSEVIGNMATKPKALVITEGWCGDAAQIVPVLQSVASANHLEVRYVLRDENPELMDQHLTNGGKSIPIVVFLHPETLALMGHWGPRPEPVQKMLMDWKKEPEPRSDADELKKNMQLWYARDKQITMQKEWADLFKAF